MSFSSFSTALSALSAMGTAVDVTANNLANLNTPGFKASDVEFRDLVTQSLGSALGETQVGLGVARPLTKRQFTQGALQTSSGTLDAAIQGDGFFVVHDASGGLVFTRAGDFQVDAAGNLLTSDKQRVQGWTEVGGVLNTNAPIGDIVVPVGSLRQPQATSTYSTNLNLDAAAQVGAPEGTFSTPIEVVDSLGATHVLTTTFTKTAANAWDFTVTIPGEDLTAGVPGTPLQLLAGSIGFDAQGVLINPPLATPTVAVAAVGLTDGAADLNLNWDFYDPFTQLGRLTQYSQLSAVSANAQDGLQAAQLIKVGISDGGKILAQYSNGQQTVVGQLALASVRNPQSLIAIGNNNFQPSALTALPAIGAPDTGGRGKVNGGSIESSTVDIAREFTNLIVYQRGYQANAKVITATDQLSQDTINLKQ